MTIQELKTRHEIGEGVIERASSREKEAKADRDTLKSLKSRTPHLIDEIRTLEAKVKVATERANKLKNGYLELMEIIPTDGIVDIATRVIKECPLDARNMKCEYCLEYEEWSIEIVYEILLFNEDFDYLEISLDDLYHDRKTFSAKDKKELLELIKKGFESRCEREV